MGAGIPGSGRTVIPFFYLERHEMRTWGKSTVGPRLLNLEGRAGPADGDSLSSVKRYIKFAKDALNVKTNGPLSDPNDLPRFPNWFSRSLSNSGSCASRGEKCRSRTCQLEGRFFRCSPQQCSNGGVGQDSPKTSRIPSCVQPLSPPANAKNVATLTRLTPVIRS